VSKVIKQLPNVIKVIAYKNGTRKICAKVPVSLIQPVISNVSFLVCIKFVCSFCFKP